MSDRLHKIFKLPKFVRRSSQAETPLLTEDEAYRKMKSNLQDDLISFYRDQHRTIYLSPLIGEDTPLLEFYVMPEIYTIKIQRTPGNVREVKTPVTPLRNVFYQENQLCHKIYLSAGAGLGKTALSKRLALAWCHAKSSHTDDGRYYLQEEIEAINEFRFVFLLLLRDSVNQCELDDIILELIVKHLKRPYTRRNLEHILFKENCLVILDGLDEWSHPSIPCMQKWSPIPHRKVRERTTVLTTTRPWRLSLSGLKTSQIDHKVEIIGLNKKSATAVKTSVISHLLVENNENILHVRQKVAEFTKIVSENQLSDIETIPLILMYLIFMWCNRMEIGQSQCELYSQITELLLSRAVQNYGQLIPSIDLPEGEIPQCFDKQKRGRQFYSLLKALGLLAYHTLFREIRVDHRLVFDGSVADQYLNKECLNFCMKTGLLTQTKVPGTLLEQKYKVSFAHKTLQEFYAALYVHSIDAQSVDTVSQTVLANCNDVKDILEMSKVFRFITGLNVKVSSLISNGLMKMINDDEITREYRSGLGYSEPLKQFQDMCISCCKEIPRENEVSISLQDVFIDRNQQEQYREHLQQLTTRNKQNIRSLFIDISDASNGSVQEIIEYFALSHLDIIEKIYCSGDYDGCDILPLLNESVKSLSLLCLRSWSVPLYKKVTCLQNLEAINISFFRISHEQLTLLYAYISQRHCMRQLVLRSLQCTDHGQESCTGYSLDLSEHSLLRQISLNDTPVSELNINMASLEECNLQYLYNPDLVIRFVDCVPADSKVETFVCLSPGSSAAIETILQTLPLLVHVKYVKLSDINLGNRKLLSYQTINIEYVELQNVTMRASVVYELVNMLQQHPQTVTVAISYCNITPESEFATVKEELKQSPDFRVLRYEEFSKTLEFEKLKYGD